MAAEGGKLDLDSPEVEAFIALLKESGTVIDPTAAIFALTCFSTCPGQPSADHIRLV